MKKKDLIILSIFIFILLILSSFLFKRRIDTEKFIKICINYDLKTMDVTNQFNALRNMKSATIAESKDAWQIEFYEFNEKKDAKEMYNNNLVDYRNLLPNSVSSSKNDMLFSSEFTVVTTTRYYHVCRIKDTILYVNVPMEYQKEVEKIIKKLGY